MADVELLLADLATEVEWPATPTLPDVTAFPAAAVSASDSPSR